MSSWEASKYFHGLVDTEEKERGERVKGWGGDAREDFGLGAVSWMTAEQTTKAAFHMDGRKANVEICKWVSFEAPPLLIYSHFRGVPFTPAGCYGNTACIYVALKEETP